MTEEKVINAANRAHIERLNKIIEEAIIHGGDSGGAYLTNDDGLIKQMRGYLTWTGLDKVVGIVNECGWVKFYFKGDIIE